MILFNEEIITLLNEYFSKEPQFVEGIMLASYGLNIQFADFNIQCNERVFASINGKPYVWEDAPNSGPWGALGRQLAKKAMLKTKSLLTITFESGDSIDIETSESPYESVIFNFPPQGNSFVMEVF
ncbi:MAG: hypothetical protein KKE30_18285 [Gammaproteobacteria bacterium]|nr:hypothetical protein [Gammaproteobacteria bacterium]MBU2068968.1 hypothetical protein [Gammaproteobacteria bacterium]MBU2181474.1 hypothetical protein [Gammaproteobacteria bacterium]MBU2206619.1 hypothetical protein [Gammaproteobacteria bacterium]